MVVVFAAVANVGVVSAVLVDVAVVAPVVDNYEVRLVDVAGADIAAQAAQAVDAVVHLAVTVVAVVGIVAV